MTAFPKGFSTFAEYRRHQQHIPWGVAVSTIIQPPFSQGTNIWAFDPDQIGAAQYQVGPTGTISTPVKTQGTPSFYTFAGTDAIDFGDALDTTFASTTAGFTLYICVKPSAADLTTANVGILTKTATSNAEFDLLLNTNTLNFWAYYASTGATNTVYPSAGAVLTAATRYVLAVTYDPTAARASRALIYINGTANNAAAVNTGADGTIADTTSALRIGQRTTLTAAVNIMSYAYGYSGAHSPSTITSITNWLQTTKGWV